MFEDEYSEMQKRPLNVEWLMMDSNILLPPTGTPMTGIEFSKRLPCGEVSHSWNGNADLHKVECITPNIYFVFMIRMNSKMVMKLVILFAVN
jgi:hypothetical protein